MTENSKNPTENSEIFLTHELAERYSVNRSVVYVRLKHLRIKTIKGQDNKSYIDASQLQLMDSLHSHLQAGGKTDEFVQQCIDGGLIVNEHPADHPPDQTVAIVKAQEPGHMHNYLEDDETVISSESSQAETIANLQSQKGERIQAEDIREVDERAQRRAFVKAAAEETLTLVYEATEDFTIPGLKQQLANHREQCRQAKGQRNKSHSVNDFLSLSLAKVKVI